MRLNLLVFLILVASSLAYGQGPDTLLPSPVYHEKLSNGLIRFFYDSHYYLADKQCQFKAIERVGGYDPQRQLFAGAFVDFNNRGQAILRGNYRDGKKDGDFKAYHGNGQLKWQVSFVQDVPQAVRTYYYPDGKPLLEVQYGTGEEALLWNFWDQRGRQRVKDGNGRYEFTVEADGYNEFGYVQYVRKGKVVNGRPHGNWTIEYIFADGKKHDAGYEFYQHGRFIIGYESYKDEEFSSNPRYGLLPIDVFLRAESMIVKACTIDDHSGFTGYLAKHLEEWFVGEVDGLPDPLKIEFTVAVNRHGVPEQFVMKSTFARKRYADLLLEGLGWVGFWFPSFAAGEFIDDTLTVTIEAFPDAVEQKIRFFDARISRAKGI